MLAAGVALFLFVGGGSCSVKSIDTSSQVLLQCVYLLGDRFFILFNFLLESSLVKLLLNIQYCKFYAIFLFFFVFGGFFLAKLKIMNCMF